MFLSVAETSLRAIVKVVAIGAMGYICARYEMMPKAVIVGLSELSFFLFVPCLTLFRTASSLSASELAELWPLVLWSCIHILIGTGVGALVCAIFRPDPIHVRPVCVLGLVSFAIMTLTCTCHVDHHL